MKPGPGWKHVGGACYDLPDGTRVHEMGYCLLPDRRFISGNSWPESQRFWRFVRINGGNRKRGAMAWARSLAATGDDE